MNCTGILRLFQAVMSKGAPDVETIREILSQEYSQNVGDTPDKLAQAALSEVRDTVNRKVWEGCYPELVTRGYSRGSRHGPFIQEWGFNSLLGAMWLQFMWLTTASDIQPCWGPGCNNLMHDKRSDARFCSERCRFNHHYHTRVKKKSKKKS